MEPSSTNPHPFSPGPGPTAEGLPLALVVDDEPENRALYARILHRTHQVIAAPDGAEALRVVAEHQVSVVITDQRMPGMAGTELLARLRAVIPDVPKIVVTAYSD